MYMQDVIAWLSVSPAEVGAAADGPVLAPAPVLAADPASDRLLALGLLPLPSSFPAGAGVEVDASESASGSAGAAGVGGAAACASSALALATSRSSCSLYLSAAGDVYCRGIRIVQAIKMMENFTA